MSFSEQSGYTAQDINTLMEQVRVGVNAQFGQSYTSQNFVGTNFYKYFYAIIQKLQENEVKTAEIFLKLQDYFRITNERILRPVVTAPGLVEALESMGYIASVKPPSTEEAGQVFVCIDVDDAAEDYATKKLELCNIIKDSVVAGVVTQGTEEESITLSNGQSFDFKYNLPDRIEPLLRLTITLSQNNQLFIESPDDVRFKLFNNIAERYRLGRNFEPQKYFGVVDAPWASQVLLEYKIDDGEWTNDIYVSEYDELFMIALENIEIVEE
jgi:hypothetical protein